MDCREACSKMNSFIEGSISKEEQPPLIWHYQHCESCKEELAVSLVLHKAMYALEDENADFDFINEDQDEAANLMLLQAEEHAVKEHHRFYWFTGLKVVTFWAIVTTLLLQILYWKSIGY